VLSYKLRPPVYDADDEMGDSRQQHNNQFIQQSWNTFCTIFKK
jgi:hypothetical protein